MTDLDKTIRDLLAQESAEQLEVNRRFQHAINEAYSHDEQLRRVTELARQWLVRYKNSTDEFRVNFSD